MVFGSFALLVNLLEQLRARNVMLCEANLAGFFCSGSFLRGDVLRTGVTNDMGLSVGD